MVKVRKRKEKKRRNDIRHDISSQNMKTFHLSSSLLSNMKNASPIRPTVCVIHLPKSIKILILLLLLLLLLPSSRSSATRSRHLDLLALLGLQREDDDEQRFVRGAVLEDVSERVRTVRQQERGSRISLPGPCASRRGLFDGKEGFLSSFLSKNGGK
jgi:hypothetical protein